MIADLPARWRREATIQDDLAVKRLKEDRPDAAHRLAAGATAMRDCAEELEEEMGAALEIILDPELNPD